MLSEHAHDPYDFGISDARRAQVEPRVVEIVEQIPQAVVALHRVPVMSLITLAQ